jgi:hypothetical protein
MCVCVCVCVCVNISEYRSFASRVASVRSGRTYRIVALFADALALLGDTILVRARARIAAAAPSRKSRFRLHRSLLIRKT